MELAKLANHIEQFDYEFLLDRALAKVSDKIDTREGSIIYDALAMACMELAMMYMQLREMYQATFIQTAFDHYLDLRVAEHGLERQRATRAIRVAYFQDDTEAGGRATGAPMSVPAGSRFATEHPTNSIIYEVKGVFTGQRPCPDRNPTPPPEDPEKIIMITEGLYELVCEELGTIGNHYEGRLLPITNILGLGSARMLPGESVITGRDDESDDSLRARFITAVSARAFGGNVAQYREEILGLHGVGAVQIHPIWNGGGTVKCVILNDDFNPAYQQTIDNVQNYLDPRTEGLGIGMAPIGHQVTVVAAERRDVEVAVRIDVAMGSTLGGLKAPIDEAMRGYFRALRREWDQGNEFNHYDVQVRTSQIITALLQIDGVADVKEVWLDGRRGNIVLRQDFPGERRGGELPYLREDEVTIINENNDTEYGAD